MLLIADIAGYTKFMKLHRASLVHSQNITARLLNTLVDACPLPLIEVEGDAAFFCAPENKLKVGAADLSLAMHRAFHIELERMIAHNICGCDACLQSRNLKVKFVGHIGEVARQSVGGRKKVVGIDVIAVHRMLKNGVPVQEYFLMTQPLYERSETAVRAAAKPIQEELEGLGRETLHFVDLEHLALDRPAPPSPGFGKRFTTTAAMIARTFPIAIGIRRPQRPLVDYETPAGPADR